MVDQNYIRWIKQSFVKHLKDSLPGYPLFIEGEHRDLRSNPEYWAEFRFDGPYFFEQSKNYYKIHVEINILVATILTNDMYNQERQCGIIVEAMSVPVCIFKLGVSDVDDQSKLFMMELNEANRSGLKVSNYGQVDKTMKMFQSTIEGHYECHADIRLI